MTDRSAREAELDAVREQKIAASNAKALEGAAQPTNMVDWQTQQKALKDAEREKKRVSTQILHSFKSTTAEQSALSKLKEEDRAKQLAAQQQLHNYRAAYVGSGKSWSQRSQTGADDSVYEDDVMSGISVADAVSNWNASGTTTQDEMSGSHYGMVMVEKPNNMTYPEDTSAEVVEKRNAPTSIPTDDSNTEVMVEKPDETIASEETSTEVMVEKPDETAPEYGAAEVMVEKPNDIEPEYTTSDFVMEKQSYAEPEYTTADIMVDRSILEVPEEEGVNEEDSQEWVSVPPPLQPPEEEWGHMTMKHGNIGQEMTTPPEFAAVDFAFALLTHSEQPNVDKYLKAAAFIIGEASSVNVKFMAQQPIDRPMVKKFLITATVTVSIKAHHTVQELRQHVLGLLKTAVNDGSFIAVASS